MQTFWQRSDCREALYFSSMSVIVSVEDQQDAPVFDSLDRYFAGEWKLLYKTFETALHQSVTEEQIDPCQIFRMSFSMMR